MRFDAMVILAVLFLLVVTILYLPVFLILKKKGKGLLPQLSHVLFLWAFLLVLFVTLTGGTFIPEYHHLNLRPFLWLEDGGFNQIELVESIGNVLMFLPLGILFPIVFKRIRKFYLTVGVIFIMSLGVEFIQYFIGRVADIDDLIENVVGGMIGYGLFKLCNQLLTSKTWWAKIIGD